MSITVTVVDDQTGETETKQVADDDYLILTVGRAYISNVQSYPTSGTHVLTIKGCQRGS